MGSIQEPVRGLFRFAVPDFSVPAEDRMFYPSPASKEVSDQNLELHDFRTSNEIVKGPRGLDIQGFTYVEHQSALAEDAWFAEGNIENVYVAECIGLILNATGASRAIVDGISFRRKSPQDQDNDQFYMLKRGCDLDVAVSKIPRGVMRVTGRQAATSLQPSRAFHVDYSVKGLQDTVRWCRKDIVEVAKPTIDAEDAGLSPRYAAYSIWRPLKTVTKDPIAVLDWRTADKSELVAASSRALSGVTEDGEYIRESLIATPPKNPKSQTWYWMPEQEPHEVLIIKFSDTGAVKDGNIARHCVHGSPKLNGTEGLPDRESIECRILAFWD
ncbi:Hypothetical predicted protein [Lecanosticta acicola]|uniref:GA4 desaturase n=1 Tax=Lecanosticta acicola TaxID=111012 RepID=A0AAI9E6V2_9PEZI|nr:Hypothetical predicted protein [Lecanosticta acicola]